jgi:hypothetical protein
MFHIVAAFELTACVAMGEYVADFADADDLALRLGRQIEDRALRGRQSKILTILRAREICAARADERARNDPPDIERIAQTPRNPAKLV